MRVRVPLCQCVTASPHTSAQPRWVLVCTLICSLRQVRVRQNLLVSRFGNDSSQCLV